MPQNTIPRDSALDSTLALGLEGYDFIRNRCRRLESDVFETRLMLQRHICMSGADAARLFYDESRFIRHGAAPRRVKATLLGFGGVQDLDGADHRHRKAMFMSLMSPEGIDSLGRLADAHWRRRVEAWREMPEVVLYHEAREVLTRAVCEWAGVPLAETEVRDRADQLTALFESPAKVGPWHWKGRVARRRLESWGADLVQRARDGRLEAAPGSAFHAVAHHTDRAGEPLDPRVAAVELLNVLRPTVAVAVFIAFIAVALHDHPDQRDRLREADDELLEAFVHEVRRYYPFFPFMGARVRTDFEWRGLHFPAGTKTVLDLYGTNHDPRIWDEPERFRPDRFLDRDIDAFELIPQGGADHHRQHRCPGEWITIELMKRAALLLARDLEYEAPEQDLRIPMNKIPAVPESGFILRAVRPAA